MGARALIIVAVSFLATSSASAQFASDHQRREALRYYNEGQQLMAAERFQDAADAFREAVRRDSLFTLAYYGEGQAYMAMRRPASALKSYIECREAFRTLHGLAAIARERVERQRADEVRALQQLARALAADGRAPRNVDLMRVEARISDIERQRATIGRPFETPAFLSLALGSAYFRSDRLEAAESEWKAAIAANPRFGEAHNNLAALYAMTGRREQAEDAVRAAERAGYRVHPQLKQDLRAAD